MFKTIYSVRWPDYHSTIIAIANNSIQMQRVRPPPRTRISSRQKLHCQISRLSSKLNVMSSRVCSFATAIPMTINNTENVLASKVYEKKLKGSLEEGDLDHAIKEANIELSVRKESATN
jgi:hypothetical protein